MNSEELKKRTKSFAHSCVKFALSLPNNQLGNHIRGQLIRSSTSVAANYRAACNAQSKLSFISKLSIVVEESDESEFWIEFAMDENTGNRNEGIVLLDEAHQLSSIFIAARKTSQSKLKKINNSKSSINNQKS